MEDRMMTSETHRTAEQTAKRTVLRYILRYIGPSYVVLAAATTAGLWLGFDEARQRAQENCEAAVKNNNDTREVFFAILEPFPADSETVVTIRDVIERIRPERSLEECD